MSTQWPYPLLIVKGLLHIQPGLVELKGVEVRGMTGAMGTLAGTITIPPKGDPGKPSPHIKFMAHSLAGGRAAAGIDPAIARALGWRHLQVHWPDRAWRALRSGRRRRGRSTLTSRPDIVGGIARPYGGEYWLDQVAGRLQVHRGRVEIDCIQGRHRQSTVRTIGGEAVFGKESQKLDLCGWRGRGWSCRTRDRGPAAGGLGDRAACAEEGAALSARGEF